MRTAVARRLLPTAPPEKSRLKLKLKLIRKRTRRKEKEKRRISPNTP